MMSLVRPEDDEANRADLVEALAAMIAAERALKSAMNGRNPMARDTFGDKTGVALSRLLKIWERIGDGEKP